MKASHSHEDQNENDNVNVTLIIDRDDEINEEDFQRVRDRYLINKELSKHDKVEIDEF